jgi:hypothetical protein
MSISVSYFLKTCPPYQARKRPDKPGMMISMGSPGSETSRVMLQKHFSCGIDGLFRASTGILGIPAVLCGVAGKISWTVAEEDREILADDLTPDGKTVVHFVP